jgi:hypothetical protein
VPRAASSCLREVHAHDCRYYVDPNRSPTVRIIRTETYVEAEFRISPFGPEGHPLQGFSAAWVTKPSHVAADLDEALHLVGMSGTARSPRWRVVGSIRPTRLPEFLPAFTAVCLRDLPRPRSIDGYFNIATSGDTAIQYVLEQPIVIERSPPEWANIFGFLKEASPALVLSAYFIGMRKTPLLLVAKVSAGYILLSSAIGVSRWLEDGQFIHILDQLFHP